MKKTCTTCNKVIPGWGQTDLKNNYEVHTFREHKHGAIFTETAPIGTISKKKVAKKTKKTKTVKKKRKKVVK